MKCTLPGNRTGSTKNSRAKIKRPLIKSAASELFTLVARYD